MKKYRVTAYWKEEFTNDLDEAIIQAKQWALKTRKWGKVEETKGKKASLYV